VRDSHYSICFLLLATCPIKSAAAVVWTRNAGVITASRALDIGLLELTRASKDSFGAEAPNQLPPVPEELWVRHHPIADFNSAPLTPADIPTFRIDLGVLIRKICDL